MASKLRINNLIEWLFVLMLSVIFIASAVLKILDPQLFVRDLSYYRLLPPESLNVLAVGLVMLELVTGTALIFPLWRVAAAVIYGLLMLLFMGMIAVAMLRGLDISCGCFGAGSQHVGWLKLIENGMLFTVAVGLFKINNKNNKGD